MMYEHMLLEHKMKSELQDVADHNFKIDQRIEKLEKIVSELKEKVSELKQNVSELKEKVAALEKEKEQNA